MIKSEGKGLVQDAITLKCVIERNRIQMKYKDLTKVLMRSVVSFLIALMSDSEMSESASSILCVLRRDLLVDSPIISSNRGS